MAALEAEEHSLLEHAAQLERAVDIAQDDLREAASAGDLDRRCDLENVLAALEDNLDDVQAQIARVHRKQAALANEVGNNKNNNNAAAAAAAADDDDDEKAERIDEVLRSLMRAKAHEHENAEAIDEAEAKQARDPSEALRQKIMHLRADADDLSEHIAQLEQQRRELGV